LLVHALVTQFPHSFVAVAGNHEGAIHKGPFLADAAPNTAGYTIVHELRARGFRSAGEAAAGLGGGGGGGSSGFAAPPAPAEFPNLCHGGGFVRGTLPCRGPLAARIAAALDAGQLPTLEDGLMAIYGGRLGGWECCSGLRGAGVAPGKVTQVVGKGHRWDHLCWVRGQPSVASPLTEQAWGIGGDAMCLRLPNLSTVAPPARPFHPAAPPHSLPASLVKPAGLAGSLAHLPLIAQVRPGLIPTASDHACL
jgi:hypothetical protein